MRKRSWRSVLVAVGGLVLAGLPAAADGAVVDGSISGTISTTGGLPVPDFYCVVVVQNGAFVAEDCLEDGPQFTVTGLAPGTYQVGVTDSSLDNPTDVRNDKLAPVWFGGDADLTSASPVTVTVGSVTQNVDMAMSKGGSIAGVVRNKATGRVLVSDPGACFYVYPAPAAVSTPEEFVQKHDTGSAHDARICTVHNGHYLVGGLPTGNYKLWFWNSYLEGSYANQWYNNATSRSTGTAIQVTAGQTTTGIDAMFERTGVITGKVVNRAGAPLSAMNFYALCYNRRGREVSVDYWVGSNGVYNLPQLPTGTYTVAIVGTGGGYNSVWYRNAANRRTATRISVTYGATTHLAKVTLHR